MKRQIIALLFLLFSLNLFGQSTLTLNQTNDTIKQLITKIKVQTLPNSNFNFTRKWDYPVGTYKDENGKFYTDGSPIDKSHLYFTAKCTTDLQGGYDLRYCHANKKKDTITLTFYDGLPAYASEYFVMIYKDSFSCRVNTIYPRYIKGEEKYCTITKQQLVINKLKHKKGEIINGYIEMEFVETIKIPNKELYQEINYFKGYFKTKIAL